jgi:hypothetical protein
MESSRSDDRQIDAVKSRLQGELIDEHGRSADPEQVAQMVERASADMADAPLQEFVPLLIEHEARQQLRQQGLHRDLNDVDQEPPRPGDEAAMEPQLSAQQGIPAR